MKFFLAYWFKPYPVLTFINSSVWIFFFLSTFFDSIYKIYEKAIAVGFQYTSLTIDFFMTFLTAFYLWFTIQTIFMLYYITFNIVILYFSPNIQLSTIRNK